MGLILLNICNSEFFWLDMTVNVKKSRCLRVGKRFNVPVFKVFIDGNAITWVNELKYIGVGLVAGTSFKCDLHDAKLKYFRSLNGLLG